MVRYDDTAFRKMRGEWVQLANLTLMIGVVGPGASALEAGSSLTLAELALIHEYGTDTIPERSFIRSTLLARRVEVVVDRHQQGELRAHVLHRRGDAAAGKAGSMLVLKGRVITLTGYHGAVLSVLSLIHI